MTKMGSIIGHRIDCNGVGALRGQRHIPTKYQPNLLARARLISTYYLARLTKTAMLRRLGCTVCPSNPKGSPGRRFETLNTELIMS